MQKHETETSYTVNRLHRKTPTDCRCQVYMCSNKQPMERHYIHPQGVQLKNNLLSKLWSFNTLWMTKALASIYSVQHLPPQFIQYTHVSKIFSLLLKILSQNPHYGSFLAVVAGAAGPSWPPICKTTHFCPSFASEVGLCQVTRVLDSKFELGNFFTTQELA